MTKDDCTEGNKFDDQIAIFSFIDNGKYLVRDAGWYGIPYRALIPRGLDNVLIAGRMMTVDTVAHNSTRNTTCCLICGHAAGAAAAMAPRAGKAPSEVDAEELRQHLIKGGALLEPKDEPLEN
ncbi:MAG: FAD-dependent oxidoreductase [Planctomycetes bacterium]|nr:FAD-dependent oxidoreductase [Planctomycetota bacterium]